MAENEESEWVGCQWVMQGFCGRRSAARQGAEDETRPVEPAAAEPKATAEPTAAVEPAAPVEPAPEQPAMSVTPAKRPKRQSRGPSRKDAWSAAREAAAAKRRRRPAA